MIESDISDGVCTLRLASPPLNTLTAALLDELLAAMRRAEQDASVAGIVLVGSADHFSAGADIELFEQIRSATDAVELCRLFQTAFQRIEDAIKPVVVALGGSVLGGALELAMACHVRIATAESRFGMPEVRFGINPGAGGTQRLPRLVGAGAALRMLLGGETIGAAAALESALIDVVCPRDELLARAVSIARSRPDHRRSLQQAVRADTSTWTTAETAAAARPHLLAPRKIVDAVRAGAEQSVAAGLRSEREGFAACIATAAAGNLLYLFRAGRLAAKSPELANVEPRAIASAAVVGAGTMGVGIALALLGAGLPVALRDENPAALRRAETKIQQSLDRRVEQGRLNRSLANETLARLTLATDWRELAAADLVVEAVFEDAATKRSVFHCLEETCRADAVLGSNTSTLSLDELAQTMRQPERLVGLHFFNPAQRMPLLEVIRPAAASSETIATAMKLARMLKKTPVLVRNRPGFIVSRLFVPYLKEAFWLLEEGASATAIDGAMVEFGFPMGPLALIDMAGLDIMSLTDGVLRRAFPRHGELPLSAACLVERGLLGQKTGAGVYRYETGDHLPQPSETTVELVDEVRRRRGIAPRAIGADEITARLVLRMVAEAQWISADGIAQRPSDIDVAVVLGLGFPDFRGGVMRYAEQLGASCVADQLEELTVRYGERFAVNR